MGRYKFWENVFPQILLQKCLSIKSCNKLYDIHSATSYSASQLTRVSLLCALTCKFWENLFSHISQWKSFFLVCISMRCLRSRFWENLNPQISYWKVALQCVLTCSLSDDLKEKLVHKFHTGKLSLEQKLTCFCW